MAPAQELASRPQLRAAPSCGHWLATRRAHLVIVGCCATAGPAVAGGAAHRPAAAAGGGALGGGPTAARREPRLAAAAAWAGPCPATGQWTCAGGRRGGADVDIVVLVEGADCSSRGRRRGRVPLDIVDQRPRRNSAQLCACAALHLRGKYAQGAAEPLSRRPAMGPKRGRFNRSAAGALLLDVGHIRGRRQHAGRCEAGSTTRRAAPHRRGASRLPGTLGRRGTRAPTRTAP